MTQCVKGSFDSGASVQIGETSAELVMPSGSTSLRLTTTGLDANNTVKTQKSVNNGYTWADQTTYNADQAAAQIAAVHGEQWRLVHVAGQAIKRIEYELNALSAPFFLPESYLVFNSFTLPPSDGRKNQINAAVKSLIDSGVWPLLDVLYVLAAANAQASLVNWKNPGTLTLTPVNAPTFNADRGYTGDNVSMRLDTGYNPTAVSLGMAQDNAHGAVFALTSSADADPDLQSDNARIKVAARNGANGGIAVSAAGVTAPAVGGNAPHHIMGMRRNDAANQLVYRNGVQTDTAAVASTALPTSISLLGNATTTLFSDRQIAAAHVGRSLTDAQAAALYTALLTYMQAVGAA